jgi:hypothetical protein
MAYKQLAVALSVIVAASPLSATTKEPTSTTGAPTGTAQTIYCLRVEPVTGTRLDTIQCWTRDEWAALEVDLDKAWAQDGVKVIG